MNFFIKATNRYKVLSGYETVNVISDLLKDFQPLTNEQKRYLMEVFGNTGVNGNLNMPFQFYSWEHEKKKGSSILWRLTLPLLFVVTLVCIIIKFIFYGKTSFNQNGKCGLILNKWNEKIFD